MDKDQEFGVKLVALVAAALTHQGSAKPNVVLSTAKKYERSINDYFEGRKDDDD